MTKPVDQRPVDPFLWAHGLTGHVFDIATGLRPSSVRDQITRARLLMQRAWEAGIIAPDTDIVISGAGIAGATCALEAVRYRARVLLLEKEPFPFLLQRRCITRNVDPNLYDWPTAQWQEMVYPSQPGDSVDFGILAHEEPRHVAQRWATQLNDAAASNDHLDIRYRTKLTYVSDTLDKTTKTHKVDILDEQAKVTTSMHARMVIFAEGPGEERDTARSTKPQAFWGYRFWDTDPFTEDPLRARRVLIAGSGDGALQDFLRLLLKPRTSLRSLVKACAIPAEHLARIQTCRQHNLATFLWCAGFKHEHDNDLFVHRQHLAIVDELFAHRKTRKPIVRAVRDALRPHPPTITLAHACEHFTHGYPLNRFLALLVTRALDEMGHRHVQLRPNTFITAIDCDHELRRQRRGGSLPVHLKVPYEEGDERRQRLRKYCYAQPHTVYFGSGRCYDKPPAPSPSDTVASFDTVILRFGVKEHFATDFPRDRGEKPLRQLLPTHLAHQA